MVRLSVPSPNVAQPPGRAMLKQLRGGVRCSASTNYAAVFRRTGWPDDVDAFLLSPESVPGAMVKAPRAQGEALAEIAATGSLGAEWRSSDGLKMEVTRL